MQYLVLHVNVLNNQVNQRHSFSNPTMVIHPPNLKPIEDKVKKIESKIDVDIDKVKKDLQQQFNTELASMKSQLNEMISQSLTMPDNEKAVMRYEQDLIAEQTAKGAIVVPFNCYAQFNNWNYQWFHIFKNVPNDNPRELFISILNTKGEAAAAHELTKYLIFHGNGLQSTNSSFAILHKGERLVITTGYDRGRNYIWNKFSGTSGYTYADAWNFIKFIPFKQFS